MAFGAVYALPESAQVSFPFEKLHDGQVIELGNTTVKALHTPRHSEAREFAGKLHASLHDKLMTLPNDIEVYPGQNIQPLSVQRRRRYPPCAGPAPPPS